jgi:hypothetical protein
MTYDVCNLTGTVYSGTQARRNFVYGALAVFCTIGILTDFILKGKYFYGCVVGLTTLECIWLIVIIAKQNICETGNLIPFVV